MTEQVVVQVEDDDASYFIFRELFEEICPDIRLQRAQNGVEALAMIRSLTENLSIRLVLVILDVFLPLTNGWEVLASIRAESLSTIPVVMFTGQVLDRDWKRAVELGVEYLRKPSNLTALTLLVKQMCARIELSQAS